VTSATRGAPSARTSPAACRARRPGDLARARGRLRAWVDVVFGYAIPVYGHLGRSAPWLGHRWLGWIPLGLAAVGALVIAVVTRRADARHLVAAVGLAYGVAHYIGQSKGSEYHLYPLATFVCVLAFSALTPTLDAPQRARLGVPLAVTLAWRSCCSRPRGWRPPTHPISGTRSATCASSPTTSAGAWRRGHGAGARHRRRRLHALLRLGVRQPTRFLYDVFFFHEMDRPVVRAIRAEFVRRSRPRRHGSSCSCAVGRRPATTGSGASRRSPTCWRAATTSW